MKLFCSDRSYLIRNICLLCFCVLFSNMYPKIKFITKNWSGLCNFYSSDFFFGEFLSKKIFFLRFFAEFKLLMFYNNIVKISEKLNKQNLLKICLQVTYPTNFCIICIHFFFTMGKSSCILGPRKKRKYLIFFKKNHWIE